MMYSSLIVWGSPVLSWYGLTRLIYAAVDMSVGYFFMDKIDEVFVLERGLNGIMRPYIEMPNGRMVHVSSPA